MRRGVPPAGGGGWGELLRGGFAARTAVVGGGMVIHAVSVFIVTTLLPSIVIEIDGLRFFAAATTLYVVASLLGGAFCARLLAGIGVRACYRMALGLFGLGAALCALAPSMPLLLAGRLVQGLGAGVLSALSFTMVRALFPARLWAPALSIVSAAWGIATLSGPAIGGIFAEHHAWRLAFWSLLAAAPLLLLLVELSLPRDLARPAASRTPMALANLAVLVASVLALSWASSQQARPAIVAGGCAALVGLAAFVFLETRSGRRLLPTGGCDPRTPLGAAYAAMLALITGVTTEIFVPYFMQLLHGLTPLHAGYMSALMSAGWTAASVGGSNLAPVRARQAMTAGPLAMLAGLALLAVLMPGRDAWSVWPIGLGLALIGLGIGLCWPHLGARVFAFAREGERELAAASMTVIIMVSNAIGSAVGGMVTNWAGMIAPGGVAGAQSAAGWLFALFTLAPLLAFLAIRRLLAFGSRPVLG